MPKLHSRQRLAAAGLALALAAGPSGGALPRGADPENRIGFSSFVGGHGRDTVTAVAVDSGGSYVIAGETSSADFPVVNGAQPVRRGPTDAFVAKVSADGRTLLYATLIGGSADDRASGVAVDGEGNAYVTGVTTSLDFPVTPGAFDLENGRFPTCQGGDCIDSFVVKIPASGGALSYATYLGGEHDDYAEGIAVDAEGRAIIAGSTNSFGIPRDNAFEPDKKQGSEGFITKMNADGSDVLFSSYIGGNRGDGCTAVAATPDGGAVFAGTSFSMDFLTKNPVQAANAGGPSAETSLDGFVARVTGDGQLAWSTYLGGFGRDELRAVAVGPDGDVVVTGSTDSTSFPTALPIQATPGGGGDAFLARLSGDGGAVRFATYLGGTRQDALVSARIASDGSIVAAGLTRSTEIPVVEGVQESCGSCVEPGYFADVLLVRISSDRSIRLATYLGGAAEDTAAAVAIGDDGTVAVGGHTFSTAFPVTPGSFGSACPCGQGSADNGFLSTIFTISPIIPPVIAQVVSAKRPFRLEITGTGFTSESRVFLAGDTTAWPATVVGGPTSITLGGGKSLKVRFPKGVSVSLRVVNPDGGEASGSFTR